jgi:hypothetical protein
MSRPPLEVADIVRTAGKSFIDRNRSWLTGLHLKVLSAADGLLAKDRAGSSHTPARAPGLAVDW